MGNLLQDLRYGLRTLVKNPGFTLVAVLTLALGIGANTAMFSVVYGVLMRPLPYPDPQRIVEISREYRGKLIYSGYTANAFDFWSQHNQPFQYIAASTGVGFNLMGAGRPEHIAALRVSSQYFNVFGVQPFIGRNFGPDDDRYGGPSVAVLSYGLWKEHCSGDPGAIGRAVLLDGAPFTVIGVMPEGFAGIPPAALWTTIEPVRDSIGRGQNYDVIARLKPDVSAPRANSYLAGIAQRFVQENYQWMKEEDRQQLSFAAAPYGYVISNDVRTPLLVLFAAIGLVLLIACVNVANLMLARTAARNREIALRAALGAGRGRILRQLLTESLLLALFGAAGGLLVALGGVNFLLGLAPDVLPRAKDIALNGWALLFTAGIALLTGILFGLAPAVQAARTNLNETLKESEGRATLSFRRRRMSAGMVSAELALALILLVGSGLLMRTFASLLSTDSGFNPHHLLSLQIWTTGSKYNSTPALSSFYDELVRRIEAIPGVKSAAVVAAGLPLERGGNVNPGVRVDGRLQHPSVDYREVTPEYLRTLGAPLEAGRFFTASDAPDSAKVTVVNAAFAQEYFHGQNALGRHLLVDKTELEVVGVAGDVRSSLNEPAPPTFFVPMSQMDFEGDRLFQGWFPTSILVRTEVTPLALSHPVESAISGADPNIPMGHTRSMDEVLALSLAFNRFLMTLMSVFAGLALALASVGVYGVIAYSVEQRRHEIGIRMALGASRRNVLGLILRQGLVLSLIGTAAGLSGALALARVMRSMLFGVQPTDPATYAVVALLLTGVALLASYLPARRATKVDPMVALRYE
ncbi:MAG TPA: ABC transporter permease [Terriglobia bacterium]|nr:ABC transporter permease [Terriglobia bacterium]